MTMVDQGRCWETSRARNDARRSDRCGESSPRDRAASDLENVRTVFVSDLHLGHKHAQVEAFLNFLEGLRPERVYLVGDIIDGWELRRGAKWSSCCSRALRVFTEMADAGAELYYTPGNHDDFLRHGRELQFLTDRLDFVQISEEFVAETADGRRYLVIHGDQFDVFETSAQWLSKFLTIVYHVCLSLNWALSRIRRRSNVSPYGLCSSGKRRLKQLVRFISRYEASLLQHARDQDCDGVICGHVHTPVIFEREGMTYCNTGDWVEHCTAIVETREGVLELRHFYPGAETLRAHKEAGSSRPAAVPFRSRPSLREEPVVELVNGACAVG